ncbi:STE3-domain-containing protein [Ceratobasidium sp. AG-I]|nr:STE3-domain-containing protein [Ceratobasidium sp. AG-I]
MRDVAFPVLCALAIVLVILPLPWHVKARNTGTLLYIGWTILGNVVFLVNSIVWAGNINDPAPLWCDISTKIIVGMSVGICAASLSINRRLYIIAAQKGSSNFKTFTRKDTFIDLGLGIGFPVLIMASHYIVQGHRYDIIEDIGCWPVVYNTLLAVPVVLMWPVVLGLASSIYASCAIVALLGRQRQFSATLAKSQTGLNVSRYFRLMALCATSIFIVVPLGIYLIVKNLQNGQHVWISWADTHSNFWHVLHLPHSFLEAFPHVGTVLNINRWSVPGGGFLFFAYFGMANEAIAAYRLMFWTAAELVGFRRPVSKSPQPDRKNGFRPSDLAARTETTTFSSTRPMLNEGRSSATIDQSAIEPEEQDITKQGPDNMKVPVRDLESQLGS